MVISQTYFLVAGYNVPMLDTSLLVPAGRFASGKSQVGKWG
jgi:hypothetical protein